MIDPHVPGKVDCRNYWSQQVFVTDGTVGYEPFLTTSYK
jgi:hypothetical protein